MEAGEPGWHPEDIKHALRKKFGLLTPLSMSWGLSPTAIASAITNPRRSARVEKLIAEAIGVPAHEIWPARWNPDGTPKKLKDRPPASTRLPRPNHSQKRKAA